MKDVKEITPNDAVVAGSAINGAAWLPEAMQFMQSHQTELSRMPCATFLVCMTLSMKNGERYRGNIAGWLEPVRALVKPVSEGLFAGARDIHKIPSSSDRLKFRLSVLFGFWTEGDHRDWSAIRRWAEETYPLLQH